MEENKDPRFYAKLYSDRWKAGNRREETFKSFMLAQGVEVKPYGFMVGSHDYSEKEPAEKVAKQTVTVGWKLATFLFFLLSVIGWAFAFWWSNLSNDDHSPDQIQQFAFELSEEEQISMDIDIRMFDISDDGSTIAWISLQKPERRILFRKLNSSQTCGHRFA